MRRHVLLLVVRSLRRSVASAAFLQGWPFDGPHPQNRLTLRRPRGARRNMWKLIDPYSLATWPLSKPKATCLGFWSIKSDRGHSNGKEVEGLVTVELLLKEGLGFFGFVLLR